MKNKIITLLISVSLILSSVCLLAYAADWMYGDVNGDGRVTANDARLVLRVSARLEEPFTGNTFKAADANNDGNITASDARQILRWSARLDPIPETPAQDSTTKPQESTTKTPTDQETTTKRPSEPPTSKKYKDGEVVSDYPESISALFQGSFYMEIDAFSADMEDTGSIAFAVNTNQKTGNSNTEIRLTANGMGLGFFITKSASYLKLTNIPNGLNGKTNNYYFSMAALDAYLQDQDPNAGGSISDFFGDFDIQDILKELDIASIEQYGDPVYTSGKANGAECDVFTFTIAEGVKISFYTVNDDIIQIGMKNPDDAQDNILLDNVKISKTIPSDMLTLDGYRDDGNLLFLMGYLEGLM